MTSNGAERKVRYVLRQSRGVVVASVEVIPEVTKKLVHAGLLKPDEATDRNHIATAIEGFLNQWVSAKRVPKTGDFVPVLCNNYKLGEEGKFEMQKGHYERET
jgi:hypothetical protein